MFQSRGPGAPLDLAQSYSFAEARLPDRELESDKAGRVFKVSARGGARAATDSERTAHDHLAENFARTLATTLEQGRNQDKFDALILVAEPKFLGMLRGVLGKQLQKKIIGTLSKDLTAISEFELPQHLGELLDVWTDAMLAM